MRSTLAEEDWWGLEENDCEHALPSFVRMGTEVTDFLLQVFLATLLKPKNLPPLAQRTNSTLLLSRWKTILLGCESTEFSQNLPRLSTQDGTDRDPPFRGAQ